MAKRTDYENPRRLLDPKVIARISQLDLRARQVVEGFLSGMHKSPVYGQSVEFVQHREYMPGDDLRRIDWKVWQRSDKFVIKQYEAETNLRSYVVVDASESMMYGIEKHRRAGTLYKYDYVATAAACLSYLTVKQQDSCGLITFDSAAQFAKAHGCSHEGAARLESARENRHPQDHAAGGGEHAQSWGRARVLRPSLRSRAALQGIGDASPPATRRDGLPHPRRR